MHFDCDCPSLSAASSCTPGRRRGRSNCRPGLACRAELQGYCVAIQRGPRQARTGRCLYVLFSTDSDLDLLGKLISEAGFRPRLVAKRSIVIEDLLILRIEIAIAARTRL